MKALSLIFLMTMFLVWDMARNHGEVVRNAMVLSRSIVRVLGIF